MMRGWVALAAGMTMLPAAAQASDDPQQWTTLAATVKLDDRWRLSEEIVFRFGESRDGLYEIESNTLIGYRLGKAVTAWAGYTHDPLYIGGRFTVMEHRAREQVTFDDLARVAGGRVTARLRVEQRWREGIEGTAWRFRPFVRFTRPFRAGGRTALILSHESFVDLNTTNFQRVEGEERMRNVVAISTPLDRHTTAEFGYLNQHSFVANGEDNEDHVATVALSLAF